MQSLRRLTRGVTALAVPWLVAWLGCGKAAPPVVELAPPQVTICRPEVREVTDYFEFTGNTAPYEEVQVRARVSGYLKAVHFTDGQMINQGDLLFEIDPADFQTALDRAEAEVARQEAMVKKAAADLARTQQLLDKGVRSREEFDQDVASLAVAEAARAAAKAAARQAQLDLGYSRITAPISGRISRARLTAGNLIQAGNAGSEPLTSIVRAIPIYIYFQMDEHTVLRYQELAQKYNQLPQMDNVKDWKIPVLVGVSNEQGFSHRAVLDFGDNRFDASTGTVSVRAVSENKDRLLGAGMFVRVRLPFGEPRPAMLLTDRAIISDQGQKYVLVVNREPGANQNVAEKRLVTLGAVHDGLRVIEDGLKPEDWVIINGLQFVQAGILVTPREGPMPQPARQENAPPAAVSPAGDAPAASSQTAPQ